MEKEMKKLMEEFEYMLEENPEKIMEFTKHLYKHFSYCVWIMFI